MLCIQEAAYPLLLDRLVSNLNVWVHLYGLDVPLTRDLTVDDLGEAITPGYVAQRSPNWSPAVLLDGRAISWGTPTLWRRGPGPGPTRVWGYFATDGENGPLLWVERGTFAPYAWDVNARPILVRPALQLPPPPGEPCPAGRMVGGGIGAAGSAALVVGLGEALDGAGS